MADGSLEITDEKRKQLNARAKELADQLAARRSAELISAGTPSPGSSMTGASMVSAPPTTAGAAPAPSGLTPDLSAAKSFFSPTPPVSAPATPAPTPAERQISTPGLDRLAAMQGSPMGAVSSRGPRSLESESGKALRAARKLQRMGFEGAANQIALGGGVRGLTEPKIKTQEFRGLEQQGQAAATTEAAELEKFRRDQLAFQKKLLAQQNKDLASGQFDFRKYGMQTPTQ
jgi:hypothetical protein